MSLFYKQLVYKQSSAPHITAGLLAFLTLTVSPGQAQNRALLTQHLPAVVSDGEAKAQGEVDNGQHLQLALSLPLRNQAALDALLADIYNPSSVNFRHYVTSDEFTERFGPTQADYDAVVAWAKNNGLTVTATTPNRRLVDVDGTVSAINSAFHVSLRRYADPQHAGRSFHAPDREPTVNLGVPLLAISGLDTLQPKISHLRRVTQAGTSHGVAENGVAENGGTESAVVKPSISGSGPGGTYLPSDMRAAYYGSGSLTGAGQTVAVFSYDGYLPSDLSLYYASTGMKASVPVTNVLVNGYNGACFGFTSSGQEDPTTCEDAEQVLDIVNVVGMAPGLKQVLFYEGNSSTDVLNQMVTDNTAKVITSSWGGGDFGFASTPIFLQMAAQGQTFLNATGDSGQFNSKTYYPPSLDPNITQVGGTDLNTTGAAGPWASETGWAYSGGGYRTPLSGGFAIPSWQLLSGVVTSTNQASTLYRNAPDVAAEANFDNTTVNNGSFGSGYGGTSFAAPRWAGFIALANQQALANGGNTLGFINPALYNIGVGSAYSTSFHDITSGNNRPTQGPGSGFNAVAGYDLVTGWGSPTASLISTLVGTPWTKVTTEGNNVFLPAGTTYRFGIDTRFLNPVTTTADLNAYVSWFNFGGDPAPGVLKELDVIGTGKGVVVNGQPFNSVWTKVTTEGNTVFLPKGTVYRFGIGTRFLNPASVAADETVYVFFTNFGGDPAVGVVKELDVVGDGTGVLVNGVSFK